MEGHENSPYWPVPTPTLTEVFFFFNSIRESAEIQGCGEVRAFQVEGKRM